MQDEKIPENTRMPAPDFRPKSLIPPTTRCDKTWRLGKNLSDDAGEIRGPANQPELN